ncbi:BCCT family transporter, partial [Acinetobacter sp. ULE_I080]
IGALVLVSGISYLVPAIPDNNVTLIAVVLVMMSVATITTVVGIEKGLAWLSRINLRLLYALLLFVFLTGPTNHLLNGLVQNVG